MICAERYHDFSCGHRVVGHEGKCKHLHGHNYRVHFTVVPHATLDSIGRVLDFSVINLKLCQWLEATWDHRFLVWSQDPWLKRLQEVDPIGVEVVSFNPTAENMALHLLHTIGPRQLADLGCQLIRVRIEETRKCSAGAELRRGS